MSFWVESRIIFLRLRLLLFPPKKHNNFLFYLKNGNKLTYSVCSLSFLSFRRRYRSRIIIAAPTFFFGARRLRLQRSKNMRLRLPSPEFIYVIFFSPELESRRLSSESVVFPDHADGGPGKLKGGGLSSQLGGSTSIKFTTHKCFDLN